jgi:predicted MFS family arabinose efflux permease
MAPSLAAYPGRRPLAALVGAQLLSVTGSAMSTVAVPWFVLTTTGSAARMGAVVAAELAAMGLFGIPGGAVAQRLGVRSAVLASDLVRAPLLAAIPVLHWADLLTFPVLVALAVVIGAFYSPYVACQQALVPELVGEDERSVAKAQAVLMAGERAAAVAGPPLAAALVAAVGAPAVLLADAASYLCSFALVALLVPRSAGRRLGPPPGGLLAGVRFLARDRLLAPWTVCSGGFEAAWQVVVAVMPVLAVVRYDGDPYVVGLALGAIGVGAVCGNVAAMRLLDRVEPVALSIGAKLVQLAAFWALVAMLPLPGLAAAMLLAGLTSGMLTPPITALRTVRTPAPLRPATGAAFLTAMLALGALGLVVGGFVLDAAGLRAGFLLAAALQTAFAIPFVRAGLGHLRASAAAQPAPTAII